MIARMIWKKANAHRYICKICNYKTHNKTLYNRHLNTTNHWLRTKVFSAPRDIKIVIASFLPYYKIVKCGKIADDADKYNGKSIWTWVMVRDPVDLRAQNVDAADQIIHTMQTLIYEQLLL